MAVVWRNTFDGPDNEPVTVGTTNEDEIPVEIIWQNNFNGPHGVEITESNSANYGDALSLAAATYSHDWYVSDYTEEPGSARLRRIQFLVEDDVPEWTLRFYFFPEPGTPFPAPGFEAWAHTSTGSTRTFIRLTGSVLSLLGQNYNEYRETLVGSTVRLELMCSGAALTLSLWWTDPHSRGEPDLEVVREYDNETVPDFELRSAPTLGDTFVDEILVVDRDVRVGPVDRREAVSEVSFSSIAEGAPGGNRSVVNTVSYDTDAQGFRSDLGYSFVEVSFDVYAEGEGFVPTVASTDIEIDIEASGGPHYTGSSEYLLEIENDTVGTKSTEGAAQDTLVQYSSYAAGAARTHLPDVPVVGMQYRLIVYSPDGPRQGQLPFPLSFQVAVPLNDVPSLAMEYLRDAPRSTLLGSMCEVALEVAPTGTNNFIEPPGCRFLRLREQSDPADRTGVIRYTMPSYAWMLRKVRNLNTAAFNEEGQREFTQASVGRILHTFLTEAQSRGNVPGLVWDFTTTHDSAGRPWETVYNITFDAGQDLWSIIEAFATQHALDWRIHRRTLQVYNPDTVLNQDRSESVILRMHRDVTEAPNDRSGEDMASRIYVQGDGAHVEISHQPMLDPWGTWEDYIAQSGVSDTGTLRTLAEWRLEATRGLRTQMTRALVLNNTRHLPFFGYNPGDYVTAPGWFTEADPLRIRQITLTSEDPHTLTGNLVLNDRFLERQLRNDRKLNALTGGSPPGGGGGGGRPPSEDTRTPQAPQNLLLSSDAYVNEIGEPRAQVTATWSPVTHATNNTEMGMSAYQVWMRRAAYQAPWQLQTILDHPDTTAFMSPFEPDEVYQFRVRAVGRNDRPGLWSTTEAVRAEKDNTPPDQPSAPELSSRLGVIRVEWDGLDHQGLSMPPDFDHLQVWMSSTGPAAEYEQVDTLYRAGMSVIPNQPYGALRWFVFIAVDRAGNESDPSEVDSIATERLVPIDIQPGSIGYELLEEGAVRDDILADDAVMNRHVAAGQITGEKIRAYSIFADRIAVGATRNLITDPRHSNEDLNEVRLSMASAGWSYEYDEEIAQHRAVHTVQSSSATSAYYYYVQSTDAESITDRHAGIRVAAEVGSIVSRGQVRVQGMVSGEIQIGFASRIYDEDANQIAWVYHVSRIQITQDGDYELVSDGGTSIRPEMDYAVVTAYVNLNNVNAGTQISVAEVFTALSNGQVLIENGAISANKIAANAITADKISVGAVTAQHIRVNAIDSDRIAARAITAKHTIVGAMLRTTETANRGVVINTNGLMAYDSVGNQTFTISAPTGAVNMVGRLRTGRGNANRVEVSDSANYFSQPGVRLFSGSSGARDSSLFIADGQGSGGWDPYSVILTGSEIARNSSGRTDFVMRHGATGGARLGYSWSSRGAVGLEFSDYNMFLRGRITSGQGTYDQFLWGRTSVGSSTGSDTLSWTITYGQAAPNGDRLVTLTGHSNGTSNRVVETAVSAQNPGNFFAVTRADTSHRLQYFATWVDTNV